MADGGVSALRIMRKAFASKMMPVLITVLATPILARAQEPVRRCPATLRQLTPAVVDSMLLSLQPDEVALTGTVRDEATGEPLVGIMISIEGSGAGSVTSSDGRYVLRLLNERADLSYSPMVRACDLRRGYLTEVREVVLQTPWSGTVVVINGVAASEPGFAVRLDFVMRRRPTVF